MIAKSISVEPIVTGKLAAQKAEVSQRQMTLRREQAQGERVLDFMQLKYTGRDGEAFGNELSVGLGLVLPTGHLNADGIAEATIKLHDEQMKQERLASDIGRNISDAKAEFMLAYSAYETLSRRIDNQDLTGKLAKYRLLEDRQVDMLLMLKEMIAKQQYELEVSTTDMVAAYIKLLYTAGKLSGTTDLWLVK